MKKDYEEKPAIAPVSKEDRKVECVMVKDGVYKYIWADTGEDVK